MDKYINVKEMDAVEKLNALSAADPENAHGLADDILVSFLYSSGHAAIAAAYEAAVDRCNFWYG